MTNPLCRRAFILGLDGAMGSAVRAAHTPRLDAAIADGAWTYAARTAHPSASYEAWGAMFHGVGPEKHRIDGDHPSADDLPWPSFARLLADQRPGSRCASFSCWEPINSKILEPSLPCHRVSLPDPELVTAAADYIGATPPDLLFMQLDHIDAAGHTHGYGTRPYLEQITATDALVGQVLDAIGEAGIRDESLLLFLSDHGGREKSHGSDHPDCMTIFWACAGTGVATGRELPDGIDIAATAPVVARALGLSPPAGWDAQLPDGLFVKG